VQTPGDIVHLAVGLSMVPSFKSFHFEQDVLLDAVRLIIAAQPGFSVSSTTYVMCKKHFHDAKSWLLYCTSPAPAPSAIALLHDKWLK